MNCRILKRRKKIEIFKIDAFTACFKIIIEVIFLEANSKVGETCFACYR